MSTATRVSRATGSELAQPATTAMKTRISPSMGMSSRVEKSRLTISSERVRGKSSNLETSRPSLTVNSSNGSAIHNR